MGILDLNIGLAQSPPSSGFVAQGTPSPFGSGIEMSQVQSGRLATAKRNMVSWYLPQTGVVEMYINPQNIKYNNKKHITSPTRTRGGYIMQYWGEELGTVSISGTTGSSGIEGINVLEEIYRNEQICMDAMALAFEAAQNNAPSPLNGFGVLASTIGSVFGIGADSFFDQITSLVNTGTIDPTTPRPTLASIAFQVEMYWSRMVYHGYFTSMNVNEEANKLGLFDYSMEFTVTQKRGLRLNFMPWHRSATDGPSNSNPVFGPPYSFSTLANPNQILAVDEQQKLNRIKATQTVDQALKSYRPV